MRVMKQLVNLAAISVLALATIGCSGRPIYVKTVAPEVYEAVKDKGRTISASASGFQLLLFIPISINERQETAYNLLKAQAGGDHMTDVKIKESWTYAFVGTVYTTTMTATIYPRN